MTSAQSPVMSPRLYPFLLRPDFRMGTDGGVLHLDTSDRGGQRQCCLSSPLSQGRQGDIRPSTSPGSPLHHPCSQREKVLPPRKESEPVNVGTQAPAPAHLALHLAIVVLPHLGSYHFTLLCNCLFKTPLFKTFYIAVKKPPFPMENFKHI